MAKVEIYTSPFCGYCRAAKNLLKQKGVAFDAVPQIFIDGTHVGGSDELHQLERAGKLDPMLAA